MPVHAVFSTKDRVCCITPELRERAFEYIGGICRSKRCRLVAANGVADHVHLLVLVHPSVALSVLMREIKSRSSSFVRETFAECAWPGWQNGYGGFAVSASAIDNVTLYIANQEEHHRRLTFQEEFVALLERHGIAYDRKYIWD